MDLFLKVMGLFFFVIATFITFPMQKEFKNHDGQVLQRALVNRWTRRLKTSILLYLIGGICSIVGIILSI